MLNGVPWWFVEGMHLQSVDPDGSIAAALPFDADPRLRRARVLQPIGAGRVIVKHADKLIIGEPEAARPSERVGAPVRHCSTEPGSVPTSPATSAARSGTSCGAMRRSTRCRR